MTRNAKPAGEKLFFYGISSISNVIRTHLSGRSGFADMLAVEVGRQKQVLEP